MQQQLKGSPARVIQRFAALLNEGDVEGALELYDDEAIFAVRPDETVSGRDEIRRALEGFASLRARLTGNIVKVHETREHAVVFNEWTLTGTAADGTEVQMGGTSADILRRNPAGEWRVLIDDPWGRK